MNPGQQLRSGTALGLYGDELPPEIRQRPKDFFSYAFEWRPIAAGQTLPREVTVQADSDFVIVGLNGDVFNAGAVTSPATNPFRIQLQDTGSGRNFQNRAVLWDSWVGSGSLPGYWPYPKLVPRSSTIQATLENLDGANGFDVGLVLLGFKIFD